MNNSEEDTIPDTVPSNYDRDTIPAPPPYPTGEDNVVW